MEWAINSTAFESISIGETRADVSLDVQQECCVLVESLDRDRCSKTKGREQHQDVATATLGLRVRHSLHPS